MASSAWFQAALKNNVDSIHLLLKAHPTWINEGDQSNFVSKKKGWTALHYAAASNSTDVASLLIHNRACLDTKNAKGLSPLMLAARKNQPEVAALLIEAKANPNLEQNGDTALFQAAHKNSKEVALLLTNGRAKIDYQNQDGSTALLNAASRNHKQVLVVLINAGASLDIQNNLGETALIRAASQNFRDIATLLIQAGSSLDIKNKAGETALMCAKRQQHVAMIYLLEMAQMLKVLGESRESCRVAQMEVEASMAALGFVLENFHCDLHRKDRKGMTSLMLAAKHGSADVVSLLLQKTAQDIVEELNSPSSKASPWRMGFGVEATAPHPLPREVQLANLQDEEGRTALMEAAVGGHTNVAVVLAETKADLNLQETNGRTALFEAAENGHFDFCKCLLEKGANRDIKDNYGYTALQKAAAKGYLKIVQLLVTCGATQEISCFFEFWAISKEKLKTMGRLMPHEIALERNLLTKVSAEVDREKLLFLSHRWLAQRDPDDQDGSKIAQIKELVDNPELAEVEFIWIDFLCVPQNNHAQLQKAIDSLPYYVRRCANFVSLIGDEVSGEASIVVYQSRAWCRLEQFAALSPVLQQSGRPLRAHTYVYNKNTHELRASSLFSISPSEIDPLVGSFTDENDKTKIAPTLITLCQFILKFTGEAGIRETAEHILESIERFFLQNSHRKVHRPEEDLGDIFADCNDDSQLDSSKYRPSLTMSMDLDENDSPSLKKSSQITTPLSFIQEAVPNVKGVNRRSFAQDPGTPEREPNSPLGPEGFTMESPGSGGQEHFDDSGLLNTLALQNHGADASVLSRGCNCCIC